MVVWSLLFLLGCQAGLVGLQERNGKTETFEPNFGAHLRRLNARRAEGRNRPLLLSLGTSRMAMGFRPDALSSLHDRAGRTPLVFNFALLGCGPPHQAECLQALLDRGHKPDWLVIEVWPPYFAGGADYPPVLRAPVDEDSDDPLRMQHYLSRPWLTGRRWFQAEFLADWPTGAEGAWCSLDDLGWVYSGRLNPEENEERTRRVLNTHRAGLASGFRLSDVSAQALRQMLGTCRRWGIPTVLVEFPEGSAFRALYAPRTRAEISRYFAGLCRTYGAVWIDARSRAADEDFMDSTHLMPEAAASFTERFGREVLQPLVEGRLPGRPEAAVAKRTLPLHAPAHQCGE